jgi:hypothetical protein
MPRIGTPIAVLATCFTMALAEAARAQTDVIRGRVTNTEGLALSSVRVIATSIPGNVTREARTDNRGNFQIVFPGGTGDYMMGFALIGYVYRQQEIKRLADEEVLIANAALQVVQLDTISVVAPVQQRVNRNQRTPDVGGTERPVDPSSLPPELQGDIAAMAASMPGVLLVPGLDGGADGFSVLGLGADQNSTTLNGMPTGANGLPRDANVSTTLATSPYDPSRGGFSGANFNIRSNSGSNFRTRGMSFVMNSPQLEWTDRAGRALGTEFSNLSVGGTVSGPIVLNKAFYNASYQLGRQSRDNQSLLGTSPIGLQTAGVAVDSVTRLVGILQQNGVPGLGGPARAQRISDNGSLFGSVDVSPPNSTSGQSVGFTFNGQWAKQSPVSGGATQFASASGDRTNWSGGLQGRHSAYIKMVLTETSAGVNLSRDHGDPYLDLPSGRVRVSSTFAEGSGVQSLTFGGNQALSSTNKSRSASLSNTLSWFDEANKHRVKLTTELQYSGNTQNPASNLLGTFTFNSLEDLEAGIPASFSRTLRVRERSTGNYTASMALGDSYRRTQDFQLQYGVRVDATRYTSRPAFNPAVEAAFGRRNDRVPTPISLSPRIGFSWTLGDANQIEAFFGQARAPRAVLRGGVGIFTNASGSGQIGAALDNTGLPSGTQQIFCVGPAVPIPDWQAYLNDLTLIPDQCADGTGGSAFSNSSPNVTLFARSFTPQRTVRSNLAWNGAILDGRYNASVEGTYSLNLNQQRSVDLNFDGVTRFTLADETRPVFVDTASIVAATGSIAARDARISQSFARVSEVRSDIRSRSAQLSLRFSPIRRTPARFTWSGAYTFTSVREQVSGFSSTAGSPLGVEWARSGQGPHQISYTLRYLFFGAVNVNWTGQFRSGAAYTPMVAGDLNGDGYNNDRAYVFGSAPGVDPALVASMAQLLEGASGAVRDCLSRQVGKIAARNSCRGPWSSSASLNISLDRAKFRMPQRAAVSFSLSNPLGAADLIMHGSGKLRGWGQTPSPDQQLLYIRGFDSQARQYRYEVNQRFGATRPQFMTLRSPVTLTTSVRIDLGPTRERQNVEQWVGAGRNRPGSRMQENFFRNNGPGQILNPLTTILRQQDTLKLTTQQADSIAVMNRRYTYRVDSLWAPLARHFAALGATYDIDDAYDRYVRARRAQVDMLMRIAPAVIELLTPAQRRKLPPQVVNALDKRYLLAIRNGNYTFVGGSGASNPGQSFSFGPGVEFSR